MMLEDNRDLIVCFVLLCDEIIFVVFEEIKNFLFR